MIRVHQGTVDTYLEDIILESTEKTASEQVQYHNTFMMITVHQAREEIKQHADTVNKVAAEFEKT